MHFNLFLPHPLAEWHEVLCRSAPCTEAKGHDHQECSRLGLCRRLPDGDHDLVCFTRADGLLAPTRPLRPSTRRLWPPARPLWLPAGRLWTSAGCLWPTTGDLCPAAPVWPATGWARADNQRPADQPG